MYFLFFLVDQRSIAGFRSAASGLEDLLPGVVVAFQSLKFFSLAKSWRFPEDCIPKCCCALKHHWADGAPGSRRMRCCRELGSHRAPGVVSWPWCVVVVVVSLSA